MKLTKVPVVALIGLMAATSAPAVLGQDNPFKGGGSGGGQTTTSTTTSSTDTTTTTTTTKTTKHAAAHHTYKGTVTSVDATAKSFVVHPAKGADVTLKVNDKTKYSPKGKGWDDVKADAKVSGSYHNDGTDNWALTIKFWPEKAAKPAKTDK
jgi:hypothetical protein